MRPDTRLGSRLIRRHLCKGGVLAYPTEGVYGLGGDPRNPAVVAEILRMKRRPAAKGLILIASDFPQLLPFVLLPAEETLKGVLSTWPGPITWVFPAAPDAPPWLRGRNTTLAVRVTAHPVAAALCRIFGGSLISTSANPAGRPPARSCLQVRRYFPTADLLLIPGSVGGFKRPTPIFDVLTGCCLRS